MKFEIDMLDVGNADSFLIRYFGDDEKEIVILIDAGKSQHGDMVADHILKYTLKGKVDLAICTHLDNDHIGGFQKVLDKINITEFWIHDPTKYRATVKKMLLLKKTDVSPTRALLESLNQSISLIDRISKMTSLTHKEPFAGLTYEKAPIKILAPTEQYYVDKLKDFKDIHQLFENEKILSPQNYQKVFELKAGIDSSKSNNSSVVTLFHPPTGNFFFTADADISGLEVAKSNSNIQNLRWMQIPHHGSINNINAENLKFFNPRIAYISASGKENKPHPNIIEMIKNETSAEIYTTADNGALLFRSGTPERNGYSKATPI